MITNGGRIVGAGSKHPWQRKLRIRHPQAKTVGKVAVAMYMLASAVKGVNDEGGGGGSSGPSNPNPGETPGHFVCLDNSDCRGDTKKFSATLSFTTSSTKISVTIFNFTNSDFEAKIIPALKGERTPGNDYPLYDGDPILSALNIKPGENVFPIDFNPSKDPNQEESYLFIVTPYGRGRVSGYLSRDRAIKDIQKRLLGLQ